MLLRVPRLQREPCVAKPGKQSLSKNRNSDTGLGSLTPVPSVFFVEKTLLLLSFRLFTHTGSRFAIVALHLL